MPSYNNIDHDRYKKVLKTIFYQEYSNFHVVFIDDASTDETFTQTKLYASALNKDKSKTVRI